MGFLPELRSEDGRKGRRMSRYIDADLVNFEDVTDTVCQDQAYEAVKAVPIADVRENVHAHWDKVEVRSGEWWHTCSKCKATWGSEDGELDFNYCPNCGAQMDERSEDERTMGCVKRSRHRIA